MFTASPPVLFLLSVSAGESSVLYSFFSSGPLVSPADATDYAGLLCPYNRRDNAAVVALVYGPLRRLGRTGKAVLVQGRQIVTR